jgi:hypothetical protein
MGKWKAHLFVVEYWLSWLVLGVLGLEVGVVELVVVVQVQTETEFGLEQQQQQQNCRVEDYFQDWEIETLGGESENRDFVVGDDDG